MGADDEDWGMGGMHSNAVQPELKAGVFVAQTNIPQQQVDGSVGQEELLAGLEGK